VESTIILYPRRRRSPHVTEEMAAQIKGYLRDTDMSQQDIATVFGVNQGRISEINTGTRFAYVKPISLNG